MHVCMYVCIYHIMYIYIMHYTCIAPVLPSRQPLVEDINRMNTHMIYLCDSKAFALTWYRALSWHSSPARPFAALDVPLPVTSQQGSPSPACRQLSRARKCVRGGLQGTRYQVKARYQVRANALLLCISPVLPSRESLVEFPDGIRGSTEQIVGQEITAAVPPRNGPNLRGQKK